MNTLENPKTYEFVKESNKPENFLYTSLNPPYWDFNRNVCKRTPYSGLANRFISLDKYSELLRIWHLWIYFMLT